MLAWNSKYELGIPSIDKQHKAWLEIINFLSDPSHAAHNSQNVLPTLEKILDYAEFHFLYEERLFAQHLYPEQIPHTDHHVHFTNFMKKLRDDAKAGNIPMANQLLSEMNRWLLNHILVEDRKYVDFLKSKGVV